MFLHLPCTLETIIARISAGYTFIKMRGAAPVIPSSVVEKWKTCHVLLGVNYLVFNVRVGCQYSVSFSLGSHTCCLCCGCDIAGVKGTVAFGAFGRVHGAPGDGLSGDPPRDFGLHG